ncbi:hypothetical protein MO973_00660 [Paenibacillus sp. TRM 82003]|nr:hypothetical protein [Paenibacillus sp. TRM 82003]
MIIKEKPSIPIIELLRLALPSADSKHWPEEIVQEAIISEYLREIIYVLSSNNNENKPGRFTPVYLTKIINTLRNHLEVVWPRTKGTPFFSIRAIDEDGTDTLNTSSIKGTLSSLQLVGDIMHVGDGFWLPAPFRLIQLPDGDDIGIIGGWPTNHISRKFQSVTNAGIGRILKVKQAPKSAFSAHSWQSFESWRGWVPDNLIEWTQSQVKRAQAYGSQSSESYIDYELYVSFRAKRYYKSSWVRFEDFDSNELQKQVLLCRTRRQPIGYFLGVFQKGKLVKELSLDRETVAWLRLGLRLLHGTPPIAKWDGNWLKVFTPLPIPIEQELLFYFYKIKVSNFASYYVQEVFKAKVEAVLNRYGYTFNKGGNLHG